MAQRVELSQGENFVRYSEGPQHDSAVSYSALPDGVLSKILSYVWQGRLACVSREWRDETRVGLRATIKYIRFEDRTTQQKVERVRAAMEAPGEAGERARNMTHRSASTRITSLLRERGDSIFPLSDAHLAAWGEWIYMSYKQTPEWLPKFHAVDLVHVHELHGALDHLCTDIPGAPDRRPEYEALIAQMNRFVAGGKLAQRFQKAAEDRGLNFRNIKHVSPLLNALHERQREYARALGANDERAFNPAPRSDDPSYFLRVESAFRRHRLADPAQELALQRIWHGSRQDFAQNPPESAGRIRDHLMDERRNYDRVKSINLENLSVIPPEIAGLTALEKISWVGPLRGLPEEMEGLTHLTHLFFRNTNFSDLPSVLERIPLELLSIENNQQPIRRISERLWTRQMGIGFQHTVISWMLAQDIRVIYNAPLEQVRDLPFEMWFLRHFTLPFIPWPIPSVCRPGQPDEGCLDMIWRVSFMTAWAFINIPMFVVNLLIAMAIRPLVTAMRDALGYCRMIHLENDG